MSVYIEWRIFPENVGGGEQHMLRRRARRQRLAADGYRIWNQVMPDPRLLDPADLQRDLSIVSIRSTIVDVPTVRRHRLS
jgi:hypothetical protein